MKSTVHSQLLLLLLTLLFEAATTTARVKINIIEPEKKREQQNQHQHNSASARYSASGNYGLRNDRSCKPGQVLKIMFSAGASGDGRLYANVYSGGVMQIEEGDHFEYELMWKNSDCNCSVDVEAGSEFRLRDHGPLDSNGFSPHAEYNANMSSTVTGQWYKRRFDLSNWAGKYVDKYVFAAAISPGITREVYYKYIRIVGRDGGTKKKVFEEGSDPPTVNTFMSGSVTGHCQSPVIFNADLRLHNRRLPDAPKIPYSLGDFKVACDSTTDEEGGGECSADLNLTTTLPTSSEEKKSSDKKTDRQVAEEEDELITSFGPVVRWTSRNQFGLTGILSGELFAQTLSDLGTGGVPCDWGFCPIEDEPQVFDFSKEQQEAVKALQKLADQGEVENPSNDEIAERVRSLVQVVAENQKASNKVPNLLTTDNACIAAQAPSAGSELLKRKPFMKDSLFVVGYKLVVRSLDFKELVLWNVYNRTFKKSVMMILQDEDDDEGEEEEEFVSEEEEEATDVWIQREVEDHQKTPLPLWIPFHIPSDGPLSHLLRRSVLELRVSYYHSLEPSGKEEDPNDDDDEDTPSPPELPPLVEEVVFSEEMQF